VLVVSRVALALFGAGEAGHRTSSDHRDDETEIRRGLTYHDPPCRIARVGAVEAEPNAPDQPRYIALGQTGVGACGTAGGAVEAIVDTAQESVAIEAARMGMQVDDLLIRHGLLLQLVGAACRDRDRWLWT